MAGKKKKIDPALEPLFRKGPSPEELVAGAVEAKEDTEVVLYDLEVIQSERSRWNEGHDLEDEYQRARAKAADALLDGPRYFINSDGVKMIAVRRQSEPVEVDAEQLERLLTDTGRYEVWDRVAPRKVNMEQFKRAVALGDKPGGIPLDVFIECAEFKPNRPFVQFISAESLAEE